MGKFIKITKFYKDVRSEVQINVDHIEMISGNKGDKQLTRIYFDYGLGYYISTESTVEDIMELINS